MATPQTLILPSISGYRFYREGTDLVYVDTATNEMVRMHVGNLPNLIVQLGDRSFSLQYDYDSSDHSEDVLVVYQGQVVAGKGSDLLYGDGVLDGGLGDDILVGTITGTIFSVAADQGHDRVSADSQGVGTIRLSDLRFSEVSFTADSSFLPGEGFTLLTGSGSITADTNTVRSIVDRDGVFLELRGLAGLPPLPADPATDDAVVIAGGTSMIDTRGSDLYLPLLQSGSDPYTLEFTAGTSNPGDVDVVRARADGIIRVNGSVDAHRVDSSLFMYISENDAERGQAIGHYVIVEDYFTSGADTQVIRWNGYAYDPVSFSTTDNSYSAFIGTNGDDILRAPNNIDAFENAGLYNLHGLNGNDTFLVYAARHNLYGGNGNDRYVFSHQNLVPFNQFSRIIDTGGHDDRVIFEGFSGIEKDVYNLAGSVLLPLKSIYDRSTGLEYLQADGADKLWAWGQFDQNADGIVASLGPDDPSGSLIVSAGDNILFADWDPNGRVRQVISGRGDDILVGIENGPNTMNSGTGTDILIGGGLDDRLSAGEVGYFLGGSGNNTLLGGSGDDIFYLDRGVDHVSGGTGIDTVIYHRAFSSIRVDLSAGRGVGGDALGDTFSSVENVTSGRFNDILIGNDANNTLIGFWGDDVLIGGGGADRLDGGTDFDTVSYSNAGAGVSVALQLGRGLSGDAAGDTYIGIEAVNGSNYADLIHGDAGANTLKGFGGNDTLNGGAGADRMDGGAGTDLVTYQDASGGVRVDLQAGLGFSGDARGDILVSVEALTGSTFVDLLLGDAGANTLRGLDGDDQLVGRGGVDQLYGGAGADRFVYSSIADSSAGPGNRDLIRDLSRAQGDVIDLSRIDAAPGIAGDQPFSFLGTNAFTGDAGQIRYITAASYRVVEVDLNGDRLADMQIQIQGAGGLIASDFIL